MKLKQIELAAFHEAGHAVIYHILGRRLRYISAETNGEGMCMPMSDRPIYFEDGYSDLLHNEMRELCLISCAGFVAEAKTKWGYVKPEIAYKLGEAVNGIFPDSDYGNVRQKLEFANNLSKSDFFNYTFFEEMHKMTVKLFEKSIVWLAAIKLGGKLLDSKDVSLTGDEVHAILEEEINWGAGIDKFLNPEVTT